MKIAFFPASLAFLASSLILTHAATPPADLLPAKPSAGTTTLYFENDVFSGEDRDYTNGLRLAWLSGDLDISELGYLQGAFRILGGSTSSSETRYNYGLSVTQFMFTPDSGESEFQPLNERRYAGWLGLGISLHAQTDNVLNTIEFNLGTVGPNSLAENSQDITHDVIGSEKFRGWDDQVPNEITADVNFMQRRLKSLRKSDDGDVTMDGTFEWGARLGTFRTSAEIGGTLRFGPNLLPAFDDRRISGTAYAHQPTVDESHAEPDWSPYFMIGGAVRGVAYDATLDGPVFDDFETDNKRQPVVGEVFVGVGVRFRQLEISYVHTLRSEEYEEQRAPSQIGSVVATLRF